MAKRILNRVVVDPRIMVGKPVIRGTRVPVYVILGSLAGGMNYKEVTKEYGIGPQDILACLNYAADIVTSEAAYPLAKKGK